MTRILKEFSDYSSFSLRQFIQYEILSKNINDAHVF